MEKTNMIFEAILSVMEDVGSIKKEKNNKQGYKYRGVEDFMNALYPVFVKHGIFMVPELLDLSREERMTANKSTLVYTLCKVKYTFYAKDGSFVECITAGEGMDSGDKATNKAISAAFKYACMQVFCIPTEERQDAGEKQDTGRYIPEERRIGQAQADELMQELKRTGVGLGSLLRSYGLPDLRLMTFTQYEDAIKQLRGMADKPADVPKDSGSSQNAPKR